ncbi:RNA methyltransferase, TrmA family protein [Nitzschia inconspicua]|uniref:RNA methyltransferase, TrmA family protein n=1 Tax=Nitzschia inconspicua TaxID=303405 RepID=A0A9K3PCD5_9STRA|nr:RNA methyltransferase, TrmA family protein [Nitzschia inconspicua]
MATRSQRYILVVAITAIMASKQAMLAFCFQQGRIFQRHAHSHSRRSFSVSSSSVLSAAATSSSSSLSVEPIKTPAKFVPKPFDYHQLIDIQIDSLTNQGWGIGRVALTTPDTPTTTTTDGTAKEVDNNDSDNTEHNSNSNMEDKRLWIIMVPHVIVGETVRVRIFRNMKSYSEADLVEVLQASPDRVEPKCSLAGICGGCQYQHMSITAQRDWKQKHVQEVLLQQKIDGYETSDKVQVLSTAGTDQIFEYRSKLTPHYQAPMEETMQDESGETSTTYHLEAVGFQQSSNRRLVDVPECPIATPPINKVYQQTRQQLYQRSQQGLLNASPTGKKKRKRGGRSRSGGALGATLLFRQADDDLETGEAVVVTDHNQYMTTTVKDLQFRYQAGNFFQNNNYVLPLMVDAVVEAATKPVSVTGMPPSYLIDCYCGSGLFAVSAAKHFKLCVGIEVNEKAAGEATENAKLNSIDNCQFVAASAEAIFTSPPTLTIAGFEELKVQDLDRQQTVVVLDPPRKGCSPEFLQQLYEYSPQRIVYMSCGPATQARDAKGIVEVGGYDIVSIQPFDLFPQTKHIESLVVFEKRTPQLKIHL